MDQEAVEYPIYVGVWTNWSRGSTFGPTLTLSRETGNLVIAFVAFFVAWVGSRLWRIACLALHFSYSTQEPRDALHHQRQVLLRNSITPESGLLVIVHLLLAWRNKTARPWVRLLVVLILSIICIAAFTAASGFSSRVSTAIGTEVLLSSTDCAVIDWGTAEQVDRTDIQNSLYPYRSKQYSNWQNYAEQCYAAENTTKLFGCGTFITPRLPSTVYTNITCPFGNACASPDQNIRIDTAYLNSHDHFGINAPPEDRFEYRRVMECAVLKSEGYTSQFNVSSDRSYTRWHYGQRISPRGPRNYTYEHSNDEMYEVRINEGQGPRADYTLSTHGLFYDNNTRTEESDYIPMTDLLSPDSDFTITFMSANGITFSEKTHDPWYKATTFFNEGVVVDSNGVVTARTKFYSQDQSASALACKVQSQICNPNHPEGRRCGPLKATRRFIDAAAPVFPNWESASRRLHWVYRAAFQREGLLEDIMLYLSNRILLASKDLLNGYQSKLADNQWMLDMQHWSNVALASIQGSMLTAVLGPADPQQARWYSLKPNNTEQWSICHGQKIHSTAYMSFSLFGILFIFIFGGIVVLISCVLDPLMSQLRKRYGVKQYQQFEWRVNDSLQLQRMAHEEAGAGTWSHGSRTIPVTSYEDKLAALDLSDLEHPRLSKPNHQDSNQEKQGEIQVLQRAVNVGGQGDSDRTSLAENDSSGETIDVDRISPATASLTNSVVTQPASVEGMSSSSQDRLMKPEPEGREGQGAA